MSGKTLRYRRQKEKKKMTEEVYRRMYPPLYVPQLSYEIQFVHQHTSRTTIELITNHIKKCRQFSIDTESTAYSKKAFLMQIHTISSEAPSFVILVQLNCLPRSDSRLFAKIKVLFSLLFRKENIIYTWGPSERELEWVLDYNLFNLPLDSQFIDLQKEFHFWFRTVSTVCEACRSSDSIYVYQGAKRFCECQDVVYRDPGIMWSLQNAILCTLDSYLSKSETISRWNMIIDPEYSKLNLEKLNKMIRYASYDVLVLSLLHQPVMKLWSHEKIRKTPLDELLLEGETSLPDQEVQVVENISSEQSKTESLLSIQESDDLVDKNGISRHISVKGNRVSRSEAARRYHNHRRNHHRRRSRYCYR